jgi:hypothetical protein
MRTSIVVRRASAVVGALLLSASLPLFLRAQERAVPLDRDGFVRVFNAAGSIRVIGWGVDSVRWSSRGGRSSTAGGTGGW